MSGAVAELLARCRAAGLSLIAEGEALHVDLECEPPVDLIKELRQHKHEVIAALSGAIMSTEPLVLRDGRIMWRFRAHEIRPLPQPNTTALLDQVRQGGVVLVADGMELHIVERWKDQLYPQTLRALWDNAGAAIAVLRGEHRDRVARMPSERVAVYDPRGLRALTQERE